MKYYIIALLIFFNVGINAQTGFEKIISNTDDQIINQIIEDDEGSFVMVGRIYHNETGYPGGYILKINSTGSLLVENIIQQSDSCSYFFFDIHFYDNHFYILGSQMVIYPDICKLWYLKLNSNLEIESEKLNNIPQNRWFSYMNSIIDSDSNIVITGYTTRLDTNQSGGTFYSSDAFFYKLNSDGDSMTSMFYISEIPLHFSFDIMESRDSSKYYAFVSHFTDIFGTSGQKLALNKNLDSLSIDSIPLEVFDFYSPIYLDQNEILICGKRGEPPPDDYGLNVLSITEDAELINYRLFKKEPYRDHPAMYQGVSKHGDNIYVGGTSNFDYANPFLSTNDSWFHLIKINPDITPIWEKWYGGDAYYHLYSIVATSDGGCLMVGNRYDYEIQDQERDVYVVKVDSAGLIVWTQEIQMDHPLFTLYPNPGGNQIQIKATNGEFDFELYNFNGQVLIKQQVTGIKNTMSTEMLQSGMYFYRLTDKRERIIKTGKWIKK